MNAPINFHSVDPIESALAMGLKDLWFPVCPSKFVTEKPVSLRRLGYKIVLWRDGDGQVHALEDHCPHRGAPLSIGVNLGNRLACAYHGVEVCHDGRVARVPGSPGCKLEGSMATRSFHMAERNGAIFLYNSTKPHLDKAPPLQLPEQLTSPEWESFLCYTEWANDYRYVIDNVMDPMHGAYLHRQSHSMSEGELSAEFELSNTEHGYLFQKKNQRDVNFDWSEWMEIGIHILRLEIPYPKSIGPGGGFYIIGSYTPINNRTTAVFHWRCRKVSGWLRDTWRFLYKNRLEERHWRVLEQDRVALEAMEPGANKREHLYQHDAGLVRVRRRLTELAKKQVENTSN